MPNGGGITVAKKMTRQWQSPVDNNIREFYGAHQALSTVLIHRNKLVL